MHIIVPRSTKRRPRSGTTKGSSKRSSSQEIRYYSLIPGSNCSDTGSFGAITLQDDDDEIFKVNGHHLKIFLEPDYKEYDVINFTEET